MDINNEFVILDGAMGTSLQNAGLQVGECPEVLNITSPEKIQKIQMDFIYVGSEIIYTNTFGANKYKLKSSGYNVDEIITAAVLNSKTAIKNSSKKDVKVALDIGPIGEMLEPIGTLSFNEAYEIFAEQIKAGVKNGVDLIVIETMTDLYEVKAAILAAKENSSLPVFVTMTFEENMRTFSGCTLESFAVTVEGLGVDAFGINCSLGPVEILPIAKKLVTLTNLPLIIKPNAGMPNFDHTYDLTDEQFADAMEKIADLGIKYIGGCCGTTPSYISKLKDRVKDKKVKIREVEPFSSLCTATNFLKIDGIRLIGERINPTGKKRLKEALLERDMEFIIKEAISQEETDADILDVNVGVPGLNEEEMMEKVVKSIQEVVDIPLQIDSSNHKAIESGLRAYNGKAILNSVNAEDTSLSKILPLVKKYGAAVVGLTLDENGIPETALERFKLAEKIVEAALSHGIKKEDIYIDCLTLTVSVDQNVVKMALETIRLIKKHLGVKTIMGISNVSFGLPKRELINSTYLVMAFEMGLDLAIINTKSESLMDTIRSYNVLRNIDRDSEKYIKHFNESKNNKKEEKSPINEMENIDIFENTNVEHAILKGQGEFVRDITKKLLEKKKGLEIVDEYLIPALDIVGMNYEKGVIFLPQLIKSAKAAQEGFNVIKNDMIKNGSASISKGKILLATVKGDVHDIGKNIAKIILENYGYEVIDLGKDVPIELIIKVTKEKNIKLVGLSALMTTSLENMKETIIELRKMDKDITIMVGGAVLTEEYSKKIGADYFVKDAKADVEIAKRIFEGE